MTDPPFRIGFTNGLMSESMIIRFAIMIIFISKVKNLLLIMDNKKAVPHHFKIDLA